ncbi:hypothetical protein JOY44_18260 [Phormidium sp. CLA17]|nr:hypothetical protein [Leptolyngbya sp. Cla-17]
MAPSCKICQDSVLLADFSLLANKLRIAGAIVLLFGEPFLNPGDRS